MPCVADTPFPEDLQTARLTLRRPVESDRDFWVRVHRDPRTYEHAPHAMAATDEAASADFDKVLGHWAERGFGYHVVEMPSSPDGAPVGVGGLKLSPATDDIPAELNLYYRLVPEAHGQGLAREASRAWLAWGIEWLPADLPIIAAAKATNPRSIATARSAGLTEVGTRLLPGDPPEFGESAILQAPTVEVVREQAFDGDTRDEVLDLWCATNDAGGAVGFLPGAPRANVARALAAHEQGMRAGDVTAVLLRSPAGGLLGLAFWQRPANPLLHHRRTAYRVMTDPIHRGRNLGRLLMAAMHRVAREDGVEIVELGVRSGYGTEDFYAGLGYEEIGRLKGGIRIAPGDERDDIHMARRLDQ